MAVAETVLAPVTVAPAAGAVIDTAGGVVSLNVTVKVSVAVLPAASRAVTVSPFAPGCRTIPLAVQLVVPVAVPLPPALFTHVTWVTPTLSDAVPPSVRGVVLVLKVGLEVGAVMATVGGVASLLATVTLMLAEVVALPAASRALALSVWAPLGTVVVFQDTEYGATRSSAPRLAPSSLNCTPTTPTLSAAAAETVTVFETVAPPSGALIETMGGVVSDAAATRHPT